MPLFTSSSGVQINGGSFYDVAGDMNVQSAPPLGLAIESWKAPEFGSTEAIDDGLLGPERHGRQAKAARILPYDSSHRPRTPGSHSSYDSEEKDGSTSPATALSRTLLHNHLPHPEDSQPRELINKAPPPDYGSPSHVDNRPFPTDFRSEPPLDSNVVAASQPVFPWNYAPHEPRTSINGGTFIGGNVNHIQHYGEAGLHILCRAAANDASHDSAERYPQPRCHPETRTEIIEGLHSWSSEDDNRSAVLWLCGPAGAGKSAISQSLCQRLEAEGRLGGTFFFKRGHPSRGHAMKLFPTIAYQLALLFPEFKVAVVERVEADPSIVDRSLSTQLES